MASPNETPSSKRRLGRRRLPPLEPGPALQFVIANHPDQFRAGNTMRHVRSHVMYKHRTDRKITNSKSSTNLQRRESAHPSTASSPVMTGSDTSVSDFDSLAPPHSRPRSSTWTGEPPQYMLHASSPSTMRTIIHHILASTQGAYARSAPPAFQDALAFPFPNPYATHSDYFQGLKDQYIDSCRSFCGDKDWLHTICADQMSFLSHIGLLSVYQDLADGLWQDSGATVQAKTYALRTIAGQLESNDAMILSILHLLLSEVGGDETAFEVHYQGLRGLIDRRGGLGHLTNRLVTYVTLQLMTLCMLKRLSNLGLSYTIQSQLRITPEPHLYFSPLCAPLGKVNNIRVNCSVQTLEIVHAMHELTNTFIREKDGSGVFIPASYHHSTYERLLRGPTTQPGPTPDWVHESVRLTAMIYAHAVLYQTTLATSANAPFQSPSMGTTSLLRALLSAVQQTDTTSCWGDMRGVFLWVCLIGGAASWGTIQTECVGSSPPVAWVRKCFSLWAVRAVVSAGFDHADGMLETLRTGIRVRSLLDECGP